MNEEIIIIKRNFTTIENQKAKRERERRTFTKKTFQGQKY